MFENILSKFAILVTKESNDEKEMLDHVFKNNSVPYSIVTEGEEFDAVSKNIKEHSSQTLKKIIKVIQYKQPYKS